MTALEHKLLEFTSLNKPAIDLILKFWTKTKTLKAKESLIEFNNQASYLYFVIGGAVRLFVINNQGEEVNVGFGYKDTFITSFQSFIDEKPSMLSIEAIFKTELICINKKDLTELIKENKEIANWYQAMLETTLSGHIRRQVELLTLNPKERYEAFMKRSGHLVNTIPLKQIASYLMMTPETLSRIRAKIS